MPMLFVDALAPRDAPEDCADATVGLNVNDAGGGCPNGGGEGTTHVIANVRNELQTQDATPIVTLGDANQAGIRLFALELVTAMYAPVMLVQHMFA
jgi:hypothetical protein